MKSLIAYSSKSGNTKKLAEAVRDTLPGEKTFAAIEENPASTGYDLVCVGFWFQAGKPDPQSSKFLSACGPGKVFLFATHGATTYSKHAENGMNEAKKLASGTEVVGTFHCQGEVSPQLLEKAQSMDPPPPWITDAPLAAGHPDMQDIALLQKEIQTVMAGF
jgi:flavodoxin I